MASELAVALAKLQAHLPHLGKDARASIPGRPTYRYADLADITKAIMPLLAKCDLAFTAAPTLLDGVLVLDYQLLHVSGERVSGLYPLGTGSPQQIGSAITYARRYCLCAVTGVAPDDDDDDAAAAEAAPRARVTGAEHERLRNGTVEPTPGDRRAQRGALAPVDDPWRGQPAGALDGIPKEDEPGSIAPAQLRAIQMIMTRRFTDRDVRLGHLIKLVGRQDPGPPITSTKDLSWQEAARLLTDLDQGAKAQNGAAK